MSSIPVEHKYVTYDRAYIVRLFIGPLSTPTPYCSGSSRGVIPVLRPSTVITLDSPNYFQVIMRAYLETLKGLSHILDYTYMDNQVMFEFHCKQLLSNGTLSKKFGENDDATLIDKYTKYLLGNKSAIDTLTRYAESTHPLTVAYIQEVLVYLKTLRDRFGSQFDIKPLDDLRNRMQLQKFTCMATIDNQFDLSELVPIIPDNATDDEMMNLYEQYPIYKNRPHDHRYQWIYLPSGGYCEQSSYPDYFEFVMYIDRTFMFNQAIGQLSSCKNHDWSYDHTKLCGGSIIKTKTEITHYVYDTYAVEEFRKYNFDQLMLLAETTWAEWGCAEKHQRAYDKVRKLKSQDAIVMRFNKKNEFLA